MARDKPSISITSNKKQDGITVHQIIIDRADLTFSEDVADEIVKLISKEQPLVLTAIGSQREWQVAGEYANYLTACAYQILERNYVYQQVSAPNISIEITVYPDHINLQIAASS
jgi:hypothetical protein